MARFGVASRRIVWAVMLGVVIAAGSAFAQQAAAPANMVMTPTGPVAGPLDVAAALQRFPLNESSGTARQLVPNWTFPKRMVVIVDKPARTAWLQAEMPPGVTVVGVPNGAAAWRELADANAYVLTEGDCGAPRGQDLTNIWKSTPKLEWIHSAAGGSDECMVETSVQNGKILITNSQKVKSEALEERAFGFIFALARDIDITLENQRHGSFDAVHGWRPTKQLNGSTMLVVGLGGAGTQIAKIASDLGMTVIATRASSHEGPAYVAYVGLPNELPDLVGRADIVVIAAPLTPDTRGLFNDAMFSRMKRGAMLIDFTRAEIIVPGDLAAALRDGRVGSAGLAWASETPLPKDSPLWTAPNLILAPWSSVGGSDNIVTLAPTNAQAHLDAELRWILVRENMRRFAAGEKMFSVFNLKRGY